MNKKTSIRLLAGAYAVGAVLILISSLVAFVQDSILIATGAIQQKEYALSELVGKNIKVISEDSFVSENVDPQIIIDNYNGRATQVVLDMQCSKPSGEVNLYYTRGDEEYTLEQKVYASQRQDGKYIFVLPRVHFDSLRIDPGNVSNVEIKINSLEVNPKRSFGSYFAYTGEVIFNYVVLAGLIASALSFIISVAMASPRISSLVGKFIIYKQTKIFKRSC